MHPKSFTISRFTLLLLLCSTMYASPAQNTRSVSLNIGDKAPLLQVRKWLKGIPLKTFEKGSVYVVEFWATWCKPCKAAMPQLSALARQYRGKLKILAVAVYEKNTPLEKIKNFVDTMGDRMDYYVAADKDKFMETFWVKASGNEGIPKTIIINAHGKVAWIGHPKDIEPIIPKILDNTWDIKQALVKRNLNKYLEELGDSMNIELMKFRGTYELTSAGVVLIEPEDPGKPDSALFYINKIIKQEPRLQYDPSIAFNTFYSLLKIDPQKAYVYGKNALTKYICTDPPSDVIIGAIDICSYKLSFPAEIYELGAESYQIEINQYPYPELVNIPKYYYKMAWWYWLAKNKLKAMEAEQIAVSKLKSRESFSPSELTLYKTQLELYTTCGVED